MKLVSGSKIIMGIGFDSPIVLVIALIFYSLITAAFVLMKIFCCRDRTDATNSCPPVQVSEASERVVQQALSSLPSQTAVAQSA